MTMPHRLSQNRQEIVGVSESHVRAQLTREIHRRWILLQRLHVLEQDNADLKSKLLQCDSPPKPKPQLRPSGKDRSVNWNLIISSCMALAVSNAHIRAVTAKIVAEKQVAARLWLGSQLSPYRQMIEYRSQHLSSEELGVIEVDIRRITHGQNASGSVDNAVMRFQQAAAHAGHGTIVWQSETLKGAELIVAASSMAVPAITRYLELRAWCDAQRRLASSAVFDIDPNLDDNLGFSRLSDTGFIYVFDEPDLPSNIVYQCGDSDNPSPIRCGTLVKIVEVFTHPNRSARDRLERALLLTLRSLTDPIDVLDVVIQRCIVPSAPNATPAEQRLFRSDVIGPIQHKCLAFLRRWLDQFPDDLMDDATVWSLFEQHLTDLSFNEDCYAWQAEAKRLLEHAREIQKTQGKPSDIESSSSPAGASLSTFLQVEDHGFIQAICEADNAAFRRIQPREFIDQAWSKPSGQAPNIHYAISRFNRMASFVQNQILTEPWLVKRAVVMARFIHLAEAFRQVKNYSAMCSIFSGLNSNAVHRLNETWQAIPKKTKSVFKILKLLVSTNNNSRALRDEMKALKPPCVPHLGLTLKDLTFIDDGNPNKVANGMININKMMMISDIITWIAECQRVPYAISSELQPGINEYLEREFVMVEDEVLWQLSQKVEPRKVN